MIGEIASRPEAGFAVFWPLSELARDFELPYEIKQHIVMGSILYIVAVVLIIAWLIGFLGYSAGGLIHILLVLAVISVLVSIIRGRSV
jgi:hypothetical protein